MSLLEVRHVSKSFTRGLIFKTKREALFDISFDVGENEIVGLAGTSGAGKSTLVRILMGLSPADAGTVMLDGKDLLRLSGGEWKKERRKLQLLFQNPASALNPRMKISEILEEPRKLHGMPVAKEEIFEMLDAMQLRRELLSRYPHQLSGGELQRVALGRLLLLRPRLLLLDEPTSMLDVSVQAQVIHILREVRQKRSFSCLFISHDLDLLRAVCGRIGIMKDGRLIEMAETEALFRHPKESYTKDLIAAFDDF